MEMMSSVRNENSRFPFTSNQWQELEHQALVYKYMISGMPIPPDLLFSIKRSLDCSTKLLLHQHTPLQSIGWKCFEMGFGRKIDPEPGRCRRTDGKKWRCSKEAYPDSKYCERHMHRGRNRSRKPVEVVNKLTPNYPSPRTTTTTSSLPSSSRCGNVMSSQQHHFLLESSLYSHAEKDISYGMKEDDEHRFLSESCGTASMGDSWHLEPLTMNNNSSSSSSLAQSKQRFFSDYQNDYLYQGTCYNQLALKIERKDEPQKVMHHFFDESPHKDNDDPKKDKDSSTTQLSISIPSSAHDFFLTHNDK